MMAAITKDTQEGNEFSGKLKRVSEERVYAFSGGFPKGPGWPQKNIHTNLEFARRCGLQARNASGSMFESYLTELMIDIFGEDWLKQGKMQLVFIGMVSIGDTLLAKAIIQSKQTDDFGTRFVLDIWCENQQGNKVVVGNATGLML
jgi:acyl dehydratase